MSRRHAIEKVNHRQDAEIANASVRSPTALRDAAAIRQRQSQAHQ